MAAAKPSNRWAAAAILLMILGSVFALLPAPVFANPGCNAVLPAGVTTLTASVGPCPGYGLKIGPLTTVLNCAGFSITGTPANTKAGVYLHLVTGVTVENCNITSFRFGVKIVSSNNNFLGNNNAIGNKLYGFYLDASSNNNLTGNVANSNIEGFYIIAGSTGNFFGSNTADSNTKTGFAVGANSNTLSSNTANANGAVNVHGVGFYVGGSSHNVFNNNIADGNIGPAAAKGDGFDLIASSLNTFNGNTADSNTRDGFYINLGAGNTLNANVAGSNGAFGYRDGTLFPPLALHAGPLNDHWDTKNIYGAGFDTDGNHANTLGLASGNANIATATDLNL